MPVARKQVRVRHVAGPLGVRGRSSDNGLIAERLGWAPSQPLSVGLEKTYRWIEDQVRQYLSAPREPSAGLVQA